MTDKAIAIIAIAVLAGLPAAAMIYIGKDPTTIITGAVTGIAGLADTAGNLVAKMRKPKDPPND